MQTCKECNVEKKLEEFPTRKYATKDEEKVSIEKRCNSCKYKRSIKDKPSTRLAKDVADRAKILAAKDLFPTMTLRKFHKAAGLTMSLITSGSMLER